MVTLYAGGQYSLTIQNNPTFSITVEAWIDYDNDSTFALSEKLGHLDMLAGATGSIVFTIPPTATQDTVRLRVMGVFPSGIITLDPCGFNTFGED